MIHNPSHQQLALDTLSTNLQDPIAAIRAKAAQALGQIPPRPRTQHSATSRDRPRSHRPSHHSPPTPGSHSRPRPQRPRQHRTNHRHH